MSVLSTARDIARRTFGYQSLREQQKAVIRAIMSGRDTYVVLSTGAGKSATYQIPAMMSDGLVIVFSPLVSLMKDQCDKLKSWGVNASRLSSDMDDDEVTKIIGRLKSLKILYMAPERLKSSAFIEAVRSVNVAFIALDECHVLSHAMRDFRPSYTMIGKFVRNALPDTPILTLTATSDRAVENDVTRVLGMRDIVRVVQPFDRPNLTFQVAHEWNEHKIATQIRQRFRGQCGIVYVATRASTSNMVDIGKEYGLRMAAYHAGMSNDDRTRVQNEFMSGDTPIIVATNAFGMGVDKPDIRFVIHADTPESVHAYAQESGRAGRDGEDSVCILNITKKGIRSRQFFTRVSNPPMRVYDALWEALCRHPVRTAFEISTNRMKSAVCRKGFGISVFDAPFMATSAFNYLEYVGAITTSPVKTVTSMRLRNRAAVARVSRMFPGQVIVSGTVVNAVVRPGQNDPTGPLLGSGACTIGVNDRPVSVFRVRRMREDHEVDKHEISEKKSASQHRLSQLMDFADTSDKHKYLRNMFGS